MGLFGSKITAADLETAIRRQAGQLADYEERLAKLEAAHLSLRGYTYALKASHVAGLSPQQDAPKQPTRDELRARSGFRPGKPMEHKDG